ncbi:MAG: hypothetical protein RML12_09585 [Xanthomonadales bacterium]|nr:hypothetical protein [Xanthomonadales bacterium]
MPDLAAGASAGELDLLVIDTGRDRVLRFDAATGLLSGVEFAEWHLPQALGQQSQLAWNPHQKLLYALVAGEIRRYDRAARSRHDRLVTTWRHPRDPGPRMPSSFPGGLALAPDGTIFLADEGTRRLERRDAITGRPAALGAFGQADFFGQAPRGLRFREGRVWSLQRDGRVRAVEAATGQVVFDQTLGTIGGFAVSQPEDFEISRDGRYVFVADTLQHRIVRIETAPPHARGVLVIPGSGGLFLPSGLAVLPDGSLLAASRESGAILRFHPESGAFLGRFDRAPAGSLREPRRMLLVPKVGDRFPRQRERRFRPIAGGWYNPARSGHGFDIEVAGEVLLAIWYTYLPSGDPIWYLAQGTLAGERFAAPLWRYRWIDGRAERSTVGSLEIRFASERSAVFGWTLDGIGQGSEPIQPLAVGNAEETWYPTAAWYDPGEPGWGLSIVRQGERAYVIAFLYDRFGEPTWVLGTADAGASYRFVADYFRAPGLCPGCPGGAVSHVPAGVIEFRPEGEDRAALRVDLALGNLVWRRELPAFRRLTESPTDPVLDPLPATPPLPTYGFPPR